MFQLENLYVSIHGKADEKDNLLVKNVRKQRMTLAVRVVTAPKRSLTYYGWYKK